MVEVCDVVEVDIVEVEPEIYRKMCLFVFKPVVVDAVVVEVVSVVVDVTPSNVVVICDVVDVTGIVVEVHSSVVVVTDSVVVVVSSEVVVEDSVVVVS